MQCAVGHYNILSSEFKIPESDINWKMDGPKRSVTNIEDAERDSIYIERFC